MRILFVLLLVAGCAPRYRYIPHSGRTPSARMCEMQAQRARDYCLRGCRGRECGIEGTCHTEYREAFRTCGGSFDKVCVKHCDGVEDVKLENQTED